MLLHITSKKHWKNAKSVGKYIADSLKTEGFIHCSLRNQLIRVANYNFKNQKGLVLLVIDETMLKSEVKYEDLYNLGEKYPHIYGPVNLTSVIATHDFSPNVDGNFKLPKYV